MWGQALSHLQICYMYKGPLCAAEHERFQHVCALESSRTNIAKGLGLGHCAGLQ